MTDVVVSSEWLDSHREDVHIVDVRDAWEFEGIGHVPGAVNIEFDAFRADEHATAGGAGGEGMLPGADVFSNLLGKVGIGRGDDVVAYDDTHGVFAARFLVTAELYGHPREKLHLLDGDYSAWNRSYATTTDESGVEQVTYDLERPTETALVDREAVERAAERARNDGDVVLVDTREAWEFEEGHIPGAVRLDWRELVDDESRGLKSREEIEAILGERGIEPDKRVVLYCNTARRISHTYLVLRHLGYDDLAFYEGSLTEWEREGGPVETA